MTAVSISMMVVGGLMVLCGLVLCCHGCCASNTPGQTIITVPVPMQPRVSCVLWILRQWDLFSLGKVVRVDSSFSKLGFVIEFTMSVRFGV